MPSTQNLSVIEAAALQLAKKCREAKSENEQGRIPVPALNSTLDKQEISVLQNRIKKMLK